jgi:hypothetical protein
MNKPNTAVPEVWFLTSELEGERAGGFRQERWCRVFLDAGSRIRAFNIRGAFDRTDVACDSLSEFEAFRQRSLANAPRASSLREGWAMRVGRFLKHLLLIDLYLPNVVQLYLRVNHLLAQRSSPIILMASSPPFSLAVVGALLKRRHPNIVTLVVDMRDAWANHNAMGGVKWLKSLVERRVLRRADHILTVSRWLADEFAQTSGVEPQVMYNVATHYFGIATPATPIPWIEIHPSIDSKRLKIVYTGSAPRGHYDLTSFVGAVAKLRAGNPELADRIQFILVGACSEVANEAKRQSILSTDMVFVAHLPHDVARTVQAAADVLLFFAHFGPGNKGVVSTKLFEYISLGRPLLPVSLHAQSDVDKLLRRFCSGSLNLHTIEEMSSAFARVANAGVGDLPLPRLPDRTPELLGDYVAFAAATIGRVETSTPGLTA